MIRYKIPDICCIIERLISQIPKGSVSTYSAIADALGDRKAARAVACIANNAFIESKAYRVVTSEGSIQSRITSTERFLKKENIPIKDGAIVNLDRYLFTDFNTNYPLKRIRKRQIKLSKKVKLTDCGNIRYIAGIDIAYEGNNGIGAACVYDFKESRYLEPIYTKVSIKFPYIPTYLFYREFPVIEKIIDMIPEDCVLILDGNGILHPLRIGIATQVGVELDRITMGVAKSLLCGKIENIPKNKNCYSRIYVGNEIRGYCYRPRKGNNLLYISPGHKLTSDNALDIILELFKKTGTYPVRLAHINARARIETYEKIKNVFLKIGKTKSPFI